MKYENTFKAIDQILWKEQGCGPNKVEEVDERTPNEIAESIYALGQENQTLIDEIMEMVK